MPTSKKAALNKEFGVGKGRTRWYVVVGTDKNGFRYVYLSSSSAPLRAQSYAKRYALSKGVKLVECTVLPSSKEVVIPIQMRGVPQQYLALEDYIFGALPEKVECVCGRKVKIKDAYALVKPYAGTEWYCHTCIMRKEKGKQ